MICSLQGENEHKLNVEDFNNEFFPELAQGFSKKTETWGSSRVNIYIDGLQNWCTDYGPYSG